MGNASSGSGFTETAVRLLALLFELVFSKEWLCPVTIHTGKACCQMSVEVAGTDLELVLLSSTTPTLCQARCESG